MKTIYTLIFIITLSNFNVNATNPNIPNGIIYQLAIKSTDIAKSKTVINEYHYLRKLMTKGSFEYQFGKYPTFNTADSVKSLLTKAGCNQVYIIAYNNHNLIPLTDAISLQYKEDYLTDLASEKKVAKNITTKEVKYLLNVQKSGLSHYYSLAIPVTSSETVDKILEVIGNEQVLEVSLENNLYSIGKYEDFEDVIKARKQYIESEIYDVFIMAQIIDERLDIEDSNNLALTIQSVVNELAAK